MVKISVITVVYNAAAYLESCIQSVLSQSYSNIEFIVIDGGSTDGSLQIMEKYRSAIHMLVSEPDRGLYDAINKGIRLATGDVVGLLNADDCFASPDIAASVAAVFSANQNIEGLYGNLNYIHPVTGKIVRRWVSKQADFKDIETGWMPAHPTLYLKRSLFSNWGNYALDMGTAADYDLILRYFYSFKLKAYFLDKLMVNMRLGGVSNKSLAALLKAALFDYKALRRNRVPFPLMVLLKKKIVKFKQFS